MGVPKFFRWLSERYPRLSQFVTTNSTPEIDNLYLDMNGIIHSCTHGNDPSVRVSEEDMILNIFNYLDKLVSFIRPTEVLFLAIDGVAPRAKMNQQRSRRFRSAQEQEEARKAAERKGEPMPDDAFDSNCITPGTSFMHRLHSHLCFFIRKKMETDPLWQAPKIIFSGHNVPGEGEHKIMEYIRWSKRGPNFKPNQRHCLYGLDADLIMLALVSHEPNFVLLREVVKFGGKSSGQPARETYKNPCAENFILLHIGLLRDYFELEFSCVKDAVPFELDLERIIDDFVFFSMLVGNDFLPALPTLDIAEGGLNFLIETYKGLLPSMGGYITYAGKLSVRRLQMLLDAIGENELKVLEERAKETEEFESRRARKSKRDEATFEEAEGDFNDDWEADGMEALAEGAGGFESLRPAIEPGTIPVEEGDEEDSWFTVASTAKPAKKLTAACMMSSENRSLLLSGQGSTALETWKQRHYAKMGIHGSNRRSVIEAYLHGLNWVLEYYYRGVPSWNWFYPFHYAPCASDASDLGSVRVKFSLGKPFLPFQQLLGVLPRSGYKHLPKPYHWLFNDPSSPIIDFYPTQFEVDYEGKRADWEAIILINFIDEKRLLKADALVKGLSKEERAQNTLGPMLIFTHSEGSAERHHTQSTLPNRIASVMKCNSKCMEKPPPPPLKKDENGFVPELVKGTATDAAGRPPGFPTLKTLNAEPYFGRVVNIFGQPSKQESLVLRFPLPDRRQTAAAAAGSFNGQTCFVDWPFLKEARIVAVSDKRCTVRNGRKQEHSRAQADSWECKAGVMAADMLKQGLDVQECTVVLHVRRVEGLSLHPDGLVEKQIASAEAIYPLQMILTRNPAPDPWFDPKTVKKAWDHSLSKLSVGDRALFLGPHSYGQVATIVEAGGPGTAMNGHKIKAARQGGPCMTILIAPQVLPQAFASTAHRIIANTTQPMIPSGQVARQLRMNPRVLGTISGSVWMQAGDERFDVGLAVKHAGNELCVPEYCQANVSGRGWVYSTDFVQALQEYKRRFPWVFQMIESNPKPQSYDARDVFPDLTPEGQAAQVSSVSQWLKTLPMSRRPLVKITDQVMPASVVQLIQGTVPRPPARLPEPREVICWSRSLLLPPVGKRDALAELQGGGFGLGDRVAYSGASEEGGPEFGSQGFVVGVMDGAVEVLFDREFPSGGDLHGRCQGKFGGTFPGSFLLNLSKPMGASRSNAAAVPQVAAGKAHETGRPARPNGPQAAGSAEGKAPPSAAQEAVAWKAAWGAVSSGSQTAPGAAAAASSGANGHPQPQHSAPPVAGKLHSWLRQGQRLLRDLEVECAPSAGATLLPRLREALAALEQEAAVFNPPTEAEKAAAKRSSTDERATAVIWNMLQMSPQGPEGRKERSKGSGGGKGKKTAATAELDEGAPCSRAAPPPPPQPSTLILGQQQQQQPVPPPPGLGVRPGSENRAANKGHREVVSASWEYWQSLKKQPRQ
uniref:5'-3' exoribonuclease 1 n=1 Tax=Tetraselmis sp. GSL018 TaxID=582737 RepID=A0A061R927_9CHLO|eukprot:CAMPEP_0177597752 /NCGR_PEP_ID=MMETSP0419_2-20121207/11898_1 /TAXON_ID=582737 /ORGANISM="Tetraselmis sp., Strain GSL018" /LENGTH=1469 /DNA_ID=CAMNT_0019089981 /DNA_START=114 /DNA_END=4523 /DNA_ORIENTATION=+